MVSHDIRQPLQNIMICTELILQDENFVIPPTHAEMMQTNHSSARLMHNMVDELLQLVQLDFGKVPINIEPRFTDLISLINRIVMHNTLFAARKHISLNTRVKMNRKCPMMTVEHHEESFTISYAEWEKEFAHSTITGFVDPIKMEQVLNNLITNAVKFSHPFSKVEIEVGRKEKQVYISVIDKGLGIPSEEMSKLFQPYKKISVKPTAGESSTGLGLSIVKSVIIAHGGNIEVESEEGIGSTFTILLPLPSGLIPYEVKSVPNNVPAPVPTSNGNSLRILVADDNTIIQKLISSILQKRGHQVEVVGDGREALDLWVQQGPFDVILLDEDMPRMNGSEACVQIRKMENEKQLAGSLIISCTGHSDDEHKNRLISAGANAICHKPFEISDLVAVVEQVELKPQAE
jgi:CheY-like chemotaxis protein